MYTIWSTHFLLTKDNLFGRPPLATRTRSLWGCLKFEEIVFVMFTKDPYTFPFIIQAVINILAMWQSIITLLPPANGMMSEVKRSTHDKYTHTLQCGGEKSPKQSWHLDQKCVQHSPALRESRMLITLCSALSLPELYSWGSYCPNDKTEKDKLDAMGTHIIPKNTPWFKFITYVLLEERF